MSERAASVIAEPAAPPFAWAGGGDTRLPYAEDSNGRIVAVADVERGLACGCVCPGCRHPVIARKGDVLRHHFSHTASAGCVTALETMVHKFGKQIIADAGMLWVPGYGAPDEPIIREMCIVADRVETEKALGIIRPDLLFCKSGRTLAVEILVTHTPEPTKIASFRSLGIAAVEIDLSTVRPEELAPQYVLQNAPRRWLYHPAIDLDLARSARTELAAKWREVHGARGLLIKERAWLDEEGAKLAGDRAAVQRQIEDVASAHSILERLAQARVEGAAEDATISAARDALTVQRSALERERADVADAKKMLHAEFSAAHPMFDAIFQAWPEATITRVIDNAQ